MAQKYFYEYEEDLTISLATSSTDFILRTTIFYPLPDNNAAFYFEAFHEEFDHPKSSSLDLSIFKLSLVNVSTENLSKTLDLNVGVEIRNPDGSLFYKCSKTSNIEKMEHLPFSTSTKPLADSSWSNSTHPTITIRRIGIFKNYSMVGAMTLKCKMIFSDNVPIYSIVCEHGRYTSSFNKNILVTYEQNIGSDIVFKVGDISFPAHKVILAAHSTVFLKLLTRGVLDSCITITDATPEIFDLFLKFFYCGAILEDVSWPVVKKLLYLADKYNVKLLKHDCTAHAISLLSFDLVCEILTVAYCYGNLNMKTAAKTFAIRHLPDLLQSENWSELVATYPFIAYEVMLFSYQNNWRSMSSLDNKASNIASNSYVPQI